MKTDRYNKLYMKIKIKINNDILYHLGFSNTKIIIVEMKEIDIRQSKFNA